MHAFRFTDVGLELAGEAGVLRRGGIAEQIDVGSAAVGRHASGGGSGPQHPQEILDDRTLRHIIQQRPLAPLPFPEPDRFDQIALPRVLRLFGLAGEPEDEPLFKIHGEVDLVIDEGIVDAAEQVGAQDRGLDVLNDQVIVETFVDGAVGPDIIAQGAEFVAEPGARFRTVVGGAGDEDRFTVSAHRLQKSGDGASGLADSGVKLVRARHQFDFRAAPRTAFEEADVLEFLMELFVPVSGPGQLHQLQKAIEASGLELVAGFTAVEENLALAGAPIGIAVTGGEDGQKPRGAADPIVDLVRPLLAETDFVLVLPDVNVVAEAFL